MELPIYELKIQEELQDDAEVSFIALVDKPAIQRDFVAFTQDFVEPAKGEGKDAFLPRCISYVINEGKDADQAVAICNSMWDQHFSSEKPKLNFAIQDEDKHIISGPLMLADKPIYRNNKKFGEHYVVFSAETIKDIAIKFSKKGYQGNVNLMHDQDMQLDGLIMFESFIVDKARGIQPMAGFEDAKDGSWFGSFYVENDKAWQLIKEGKVKGFSVEGYFEYPMDQKRPETYAEKKLAELAELLKVPLSIK
jgi:hypothetical protein